MSLLMLGNVVALIAAIIMFGIGFIKDRKHILIVQCTQFGVNCISNLLLGGIAGAISNLLNVVRNLYCLKYKLSLIPGLAFVTVQALIMLRVNTEGMIGWLPVLAALSFTMFINEKNEVRLKIVIIFGLLCWAIYDFTISSYVACVADVISVFSNIWGIGCIVHERGGKV